MSYIPRGWQKATKKELKFVKLELFKNNPTFWDRKNNTWIIDASCIYTDGEVYLGQFHKNYPMNVVYDSKNRKLVIITKKPNRKKNAKKLKPK